MARRYRLGGQVGPVTLGSLDPRFSESHRIRYHVLMQVTAMFEQVPQDEPYCHDPLGRPQIRDYKQLLQLMNAVLGTAPK